MNRTWFKSCCLIVLALAAGGCGTTREKQATSQLLLSDAVDRAVARIDFTPLRGERVFLDTTYVRQVKGDGFVNADYIISSVRQQMVLAGCLLQDNREEADYIAEARVGALGSDGHDVTYGLAGSQGLSAAASLVSNSLPISLPEVSLARRMDDSAASKVAVFAYHRETREPVWQSGLSVARSSAESKWILGAGPFQSGSIYEGTRFAGDRLQPSPLKRGGEIETLERADNLYRNAAVWSPDLRSKLFDEDSPRSEAQPSEPLAETPGAAETISRTPSDGSTDTDTELQR